jgi:nicotinamide-nucleotide amidase
LADLSAQLLAGFEQLGVSLAIAESLTGGALCAELVSAPGASKVVLGGVIAYQTELKHSLLGVSKQLLAEAGAVSAEVAAEMASGVRLRFAEQLGIDASRVIGVATTGVAGPDLQDGHPAGKVFIAISASGDYLAMDAVFAHHFLGDRSSIRAQTVDAAVLYLWEGLRNVVG